MKTNVSRVCALLTMSGCLFLVDLNAADAPKKSKAYPLKTCIVTDEKLGEMGDPYVFTHEGQEVKLCCKSCKKDFDKNPAKYMKKVKADTKK